MNRESMHIEYTWQGQHYWNISKSEFGNYEVYCTVLNIHETFSSIDDAIEYINGVEE